MKPAIRPLLLVLGTLALGACTGTQGQIQQALDNAVMGTLVGRPYASVTAVMPSLPFGPPSEPPYGRLFSVSDLPDGSRLHRHMIRDIGQSSSVSILGITTQETQRFSYRLMYFKVDRAGIVRDTANGFWLGESQRCVGYLGNIFQTCENPQALAADVTFFDTLVKTADGRPLDAWLRPR